jgi:molybdopterin-guanine dinucleotide biosynthesis adapter protein
MRRAHGSHAPVIGIAGWKKSGKTTLVTRLIAEFTARGLKVATVKHAHHAFAIDEREADSAQHRRAGARQVAVVSSKRWALISELADETPEPELDEVLSWIGPCDLIIVEGYKRAPIPKIEVRRSAAVSDVPLAATDPGVCGIAADYAVEERKLPVFHLDDTRRIADFIAETVRLRAPGPAATTTPRE